jgi:hypothetical protein
VGSSDMIQDTLCEKQEECEEKGKNEIGDERKEIAEGIISKVRRKKVDLRKQNERNGNTG